MKNIAFRLLLETVCWFTVQSTTAMWYWPDTLKFWKLGYRIFHERFVLFMSGMKSIGNAINAEEELGNYDPLNSAINFAVPSVSLIASHNQSNFPPTIKPGIIETALESIDTAKDYVICVDGKKLAPGLDDKYRLEDTF